MVGGRVGGIRGAVGRKEGNERLEEGRKGIKEKGMIGGREKE